MIFEVKCDEERTYELTDRTHTRIVSFIVLDRVDKSQYVNRYGHWTYLDNWFDQVTCYNDYLNIIL